MHISHTSHRIAPRIRQSFVPFLLTLTFALGGGCAVNPATGERQFDLLSSEREVAIGEEAAPDFIQELGGEVPSEVVRGYVNDIGQDLAGRSERPNLPWEFYVLDSATVNAFALPGGKIFVTRGLLAEMENEAQLAGVLGHEIAHVTAEHVDQQLGRQMVVQLGLAGVGAATSQSDDQWVQVLGAGAEVGGGLYLLSFSRSQENQADELGVRYMAQAGYNPLGQVQAMEILQQQAAQGGQPIEFLSTHPHPGTRIERLKRLIPREYPGYDDPAQYRFGRDAFQANVAAEFDAMPAPEHDPERQRTGQR